jgi:hypothetical protein
MSLTNILKLSSISLLTLGGVIGYNFIVDYSSQKRFGDSDKGVVSDISLTSSENSLIICSGIATGAVISPLIVPYTAFTLIYKLIKKQREKM